jgi:hypothetical protein
VTAQPPPGLACPGPRPHQHPVAHNPCCSHLSLLCSIAKPLVAKPTFARSSDSALRSAIPSDTVEDNGPFQGGSQVHTFEVLTSSLGVTCVCWGFLSGFICAGMESRGRPVLAHTRACAAPMLSAGVLSSCLVSTKRGPAFWWFAPELLIMCCVRAPGVSRRRRLPVLLCLLCCCVDALA